MDAVHDRGGRFLLQLWHTGRISRPDLHGGQTPVAASAIRPEGQAFTNDGMKDRVEPRALETGEIPAIVEDYRRAAENAQAAGFDGVEVHSANYYLLEQFVRDSSNQRDDQYGGSIDHESPDEIDFTELRLRSPGAYIGQQRTERRRRRPDAHRRRGRPHLLRPALHRKSDLVKRIRTGAPLAEAPQEYWCGGDEMDYSDWPAMQPQAA